jgi:hypothetical protein
MALAGINLKLTRLITNALVRHANAGDIHRRIRNHHQYASNDGHGNTANWFVGG